MTSWQEVGDDTAKRHIGTVGLGAPFTTPDPTLPRKPAGARRRAQREFTFTLARNSSTTPENEARRGLRENKEKRGLQTLKRRWRRIISPGKMGVEGSK